jgi:heme/copper-type cytochrome/quinol oxidase subunit 2
MKITAYFYDKYTAESIWLAVILWPIYFIPFYLFYKDDKPNINQNLILPVIASLILASFTALIFANTLIEYIVFFLGVGILLWGSVAMMKPSKKSVWLFLLGIIITTLCGLAMYLMRKYFYSRNKSPTTDGYINFSEPGYWLWTIFQLILYVYIIIYMYNK